jgi:FkbM family methyltransferase
MILKHIKYITIKLMKFFVYTLVNLKKPREFDKILTDVFDLAYDDNECLVIFDVGANNGSSIDRFQKLFKNHLNIHSFEPSKRMFVELQKQFSEDDRITLVNMGVGDKPGELVFNDHITSSGSSSFIGTVQGLKFAQRRKINEETTDRYSVKIDSLDHYCKVNQVKHINFLKIDVQGLEDLVILGCKELLEDNLIDIIELEVIVAQVYNKRTSFYDVEKGLVDYGYRLISLSPDGRFFHGQRPIDIFENAELQFDAIYVKDELYKKISKNING